VPVLAEQTIEGAGLVEHGQVLIAVFWAVAVSKFWIARPSPTGTDPIRHTIGGQAVVIPTDVGSIRRGTLEPIRFIETKSTKASALWGQAAFIYTNTALGASFRGRRTSREVEYVPSLVVSLLYLGQNCSEVLPDTIKADP
jgi:hypothetical protein